MVGAIRDGLQSRPAAARSLLQHYAHEALQSPAALSLLLHALPGAEPSSQAAFLSTAASLLPVTSGASISLSCHLAFSQPVIFRILYALHA